MLSSIDCVIVGYNEGSLTEQLERTAPLRAHSGGYKQLLVNSVRFNGRRMRYFELLNETVRAATGVPGRYHVAKLPSLGVYYLTNYLRAHGVSAEYVNFFNEERDHFRDLLRHAPRAVAITTTFYFEAQPIQEIADFVREHSPSTKIIVGGPHIFNVCNDHCEDMRDALLEEIGADVYVFDSQGELTLTRVCQELKRPHPDLSRIPNVIQPAPDGTMRWGPREIEHNDLNADAVDWSRFDSTLLTPTVQARTARSCAYKCAFCRYPVMAGDLDLASLETVERELDTLARMGVSHILFIDDTFNIPLKRFKDICRLMIRKQYGFRWFSYFRCANADHESFDLMAQAGCAGVFLGIESADDGVLKVMNKVATAAKYLQGIQALNSRGIITYASFIIGHPSETEDSAMKTLAFIDEAKPAFYGLEAFFYDPKVPIGRRADEFGMKGSGYAWKHNTMDWQRAFSIVENGHRTIGASTMLPLASFDVWSVAYLIGQGFTREQLQRFLGVARNMLVRGLDSDVDDTARDAPRLVEALGLVPSGAAPFRSAPSRSALSPAMTSRF
jgi:p-methyltransferase